MKKWYSILLFIFCMIGIRVNASSWMFLWDEATTTIEIPLGGNLQNYISIPKATLYQDGNLLSDAEISYITTGDWLYLLTDVDTHKVGEYQVWYKAVENKYKPGQCQGYKTLVTFKVVDLEKPKFIECPKELTYLIGSPKPNYLSQIIAKDNSGNCSITLDDSLVDYETPGVYHMVARASDDMNITEQEITLIVEDPIGPVITFLGENNHILIAKGEDIQLQKYFKAIDKIDGDVTDSISYSPFSTEQEGCFDLEVNFTDKNNNASSITIQIEIVNRDQVSIELFKESLILEYTEDFVEALKKNIKSAYYGKTNIVNQIEIHTEDVKNEVGSYVAYYTFRTKDKEERIDCSLKLLSNSAPTLMVENINTNKNEKPKILDFIKVQDPSDPNIISKVEYDDSLVDYSKAGTYPVRVIVTNSSNLSSIETLYVTIYESSSQSIENAGNIFMVPVLIGIVLFGGGIFLFVHFKKKKNCNKTENQL